MQVALDAFGPGQAAQHRELLFLRDLPMRQAVFEALSQPQALAGAGDVRELGRELAAVDPLQQRQDVLQLHAGVARSRQAAGIELAAEIGRLEPEEVELQHGRRVPFPQTQRIEVRDLVPAQTVDLDQPRHGGLLLARRRIGGRAHARRNGTGRRLGLQPLAERFDYRTVRDVVCVGELAEKAAPGIRNASRSLEIGFVQRLDEGGVGSL
jgi:hypothetical protein